MSPARSSTAGSASRWRSKRSSASRCTSRVATICTFRCLNCSTFRSSVWTWQKSYKNPPRANANPICRLNFRGYICVATCGRAGAGRPASSGLHPLRVAPRRRCLSDRKSAVVMWSPRLRARLGLAAAFAVLAASFTTLLIVPRHSRPVALADVGTIAPDFALYDTAGQVVTLSDYRGQAVVLFFSSISSPQSAQYSDRVDRLARDYSIDGRVKFFAINTSPADKLDPLLIRVDPRVS